MIRPMQSELPNVRAKSSGAMMVLAVNIVGDRSTDSNELRSGSYRQKPSFGKKHADDIGERHTAFAAKYASRFIETQNAVEPPTVDERAVCVDAGVAIATAQTIGQNGRIGGRRKNGCDLIVPGRLVDVGVRGSRESSPGEIFSRRATRAGISFRRCCRLSRHVRS